MQVCAKIMKTSIKEPSSHKYDALWVMSVILFTFTLRKASTTTSNQIIIMFSAKQLSPGSDQNKSIEIYVANCITLS